MTELGVTEDLVERARRVYWEKSGALGEAAAMRAALAAVVPEVRRAVAEEIAAANEHAADELDMPFMDGYGEHQDWFKDLLHAQAAKAREIGGVQ